MGTTSMKTASKLARSKQKPFVFSVLLISLPLVYLIVNFRPPIHQITPHSRSRLKHYSRHAQDPWVKSGTQLPEWFRLIENDMGVGRKIKVGLVNMDGGAVSEYGSGLNGRAETVAVSFDRISGSLKWEDFFPEWIDEDEKFAPPSCPEIPMPILGEYHDLDVIVARVPCGNAMNKRVPRDLLRLQVNLVVANLLVVDGWEKHKNDRKVYAVFLGSCGPMVEIFRCDDLVARVGDHWVYKPDQRKLKQKVLMPVGSCQLAPPYAVDGEGKWRNYMTQIQRADSERTSYLQQSLQAREAYVTVLHSSEAYVCGAIALAWSIRRSNSTRDLVLLADNSIGKKSLVGLRAAGWKIRHIKRIRSPHAEEGAYNEWNYSKLRVWQLTQYDKVIFIDADLIVLRNIDEFFVYPQLSASGNDQFLFNSGIMVLEPSNCVFEQLMQKSYELKSYNGGDQGFLNEFFTWWHRLPTKINFLKVFDWHGGDKEHVIPGNLYAIHYLGLKPWMCYRDYDCNWDKEDHLIFASNSANDRWWEVYDSMPGELKSYCALTEHMDFRIRKWRGIAKKSNLKNGHWKNRVRDPRRLRHEE
ncbi:hypothetical protein CRG98_028106 [Punica granatum]|uniref:Hexosyltransferase n=1 Tax=Punica granatum TaxID=22663 RepID=A0A2I0J766_PUNGR|nr:hypothetical protein CRG98_028106 [Punica granatum]